MYFTYDYVRFIRNVTIQQVTGPTLTRDILAVARV